MLTPGRAISPYVESVRGVQVPSVANGTSEGGEDMASAFSPSAGVDRLQELILYLAQKMERDRHKTPSRMKLAKLLFRIDFEAYAARGRPVTDTPYAADKYGPKPVDELLATRELKDALRFDWERPWDRMEVPVAKDEPRMEVFEPWERRLIDAIADQYRSKTASAMVEEAHEFPGWIHAWDEGRGERTPVPYEAIFWDESRTEAEPWENEYARELAEARRL